MARKENRAKNSFDQVVRSDHSGSYVASLLLQRSPAIFIAQALPTTHAACTNGRTIDRLTQLKNFLRLAGPGRLRVGAHLPRGAILPDVWSRSSDVMAKMIKATRAMKAAMVVAPVGRQVTA